MNTRKMFPTDLINDVILSMHGDTGRPCLDAARRTDAVSWLTRVLVDRAAFSMHIDYLRQQLGVVEAPGAGPLVAPLFLGFPRGLPLTENDAFQITETGLEHVTDQVLAELLVNPVALDLLSRLIEESSAETWQTAQSIVGKEVFGDSLSFSIRELIEDNALSDSSTQSLVGGRLTESQAPFNTGTDAPRWTFRRSAKEIGWKGTGSARFTALWDATSGNLHFRVFGLLVLGPGCRVEVRWLKPDGAVWCCANAIDLNQVLCMHPADSRPPDPLDRFSLHYEQQLGSKPTRVMDWEGAFGEPQK